MGNKEIILAMLLSVSSGMIIPNQSGPVQSGIVVPTKVLIGGVAITGMVIGSTLWHLKRRSDRLEAKLEARNKDLIQQDNDRRMGNFRSIFYTLGDIASWGFGFTSGYLTSARIIGRSAIGLAWNKKEDPRAEDDLQECINHANFTSFSSQVSSGWLYPSACNPNKIVDGKPVWRRIFEKFSADKITRLKWISCLSQNKAVNWEIKDASGCTALHYAVRQGDAGLARLLINSGAKPDKGVVGGDNDGMSALHFVSEINDPENRIRIATELLHSRNIDIEGRFVHGGYTPLAGAALLQRSDLVQLYLRCGASIEVKSNHGDTPLFIAVKSGNKDTVAELLKHDNGRTINIKNIKGDTPLCWAIRNKKHDLVHLLWVNTHTDKQLLGAGNKTPVQCLLDNSDAQSLAILSGMRAGSINGSKELFDTAITNKKYLAAQFLFETALTDEEREEVKVTTLIENVRAGNIELVRLLVSIEGLGLNFFYGPKQITLLHEAAMTGNSRLFFLIRHAMQVRGINVARENVDGETAQQVLDRAQRIQSSAAQAKSWYRNLW